MKNTLNRYIELAERIAANPDEQKKYTGLCGLMGEIKITIPNVITANQKAIDSNKELRFWHTNTPHKPFNDYDKIGLIHFVKEQHSDIQAWEQETADKQREHQNKLEQYSETDFLPETVFGTEIHHTNCMSVRKPQTQPHPDQIYCLKGRNYYRQWNDNKNSPYFRLFWQIWQQGNTADFESICEMVWLYITLKNEVATIAEYLELTGATPQPAKEPTTPQPTTPTPQPTATPNPLLGNKEFMNVLQRAINKGFVFASGNGYKCKSLTWLAVFADELNAKGINQTKFADIERLFALPNGLLTNKFQKAIGQKNYEKMRAEIIALF